MNAPAKKKVITNSAIMAVALAVILVLSVVANTYGDWIDTWLGRGAQITTSTSDLDGNYIDFKAKTNEEARDNAAAVTLKTAEEGMILLRNDNNASLPVPADTKVTILGYKAWHNNMSGGEDPSTTENAVSLAQGLKNGFATNEAVNALYEAASGDFDDPETAFKGVEDSFQEYNTAVIVIARNSGEGSDQVRTTLDNGVDRTGLSINTAEYKLIDYASPTMTTSTRRHTRSTRATTSSTSPRTAIPGLRSRTATAARFGYTTFRPSSCITSPASASARPTLSWRPTRSMTKRTISSKRTTKAIPATASFIR